MNVMEVFLNHNHDVRRPPEGARVSMREKPRRNITELQTEHIGQICTGPARRTTVARPRSVGAGGARRSGALNGAVSGVLCVGPKSRAQAKSARGQRGLIRRVAPPPAQPPRYGAGSPGLRQLPQRQSRTTPPPPVRIASARAMRRPGYS